MIKIFGKIFDELFSSGEDNKPVFLASSSDMGKMDADCVKTQNISFAELMEKAAQSAFDCITLNCKDINKIVILCGNGNNGGDGYILGRLFSEAGFNVCVIKILNAGDLSDEKLQEILSGSDIIIDAVFGTGFKGQLMGEALRVIKFANHAQSKKIALDVPSGVDCDTGTAAQNSFKADLTVTFEFIKRGMVSYPAAGFTGDVEVVSIGFGKETRDIILDNSEKSILLTYDYVKKMFDYCILDKRKSRNTNKGDFGKLLAICGSKNMTGAAYFASMGALRTGVGLLYLSSEEKALDILQTKLNEPVFMPIDFYNFESIIKSLNNVGANALLIGPGLGVENSSKIIDMLNDTCDINIKTIIFDADGINALCGNINILYELKAEKILTPHPGEMARLCKAAGFIGIDSPADVQENRITAASDFARKYNCTLVLKGANTVIAGKNGGIYINPTGNPGMSKGGSGDILAGMIASYCAQGADPITSACIAVYFHSLAGDIASRKYSETGMLPSDMLNIIAEIQK